MTKTYTKKVVKWMLIIGAANATIPFILAAFDKNPVSELGIAWITEIVAVIIGYLLKSFKENKQRARQRHEDLVAGIPDESGFKLPSAKEMLNEEEEQP